MGRLNIVAIGGTGARCLEAVVHLCAAGLGPEHLFAMVVDTDESHGNIEKLKRVISGYQGCYDLVSAPRPIFGTKIEVPAGGLTWSPAGQGESLREYFEYDTLISSLASDEQQRIPDSNRLGHLCDMLYSRSELNLTWDRGFCGSTSIGAPVMSRIEDHLERNPWSRLIQNIDDDLSLQKEAHLFILASGFGAAGASGFPVVARILRERFAGRRNLYVGGALVLPYFSFSVPPGRSGVFASPRDFLLKSKVALKHYSDFWEKESCPYDAIYLTGDKVLDVYQDNEERPFALGGPPQNNFAHYVELLAALSSFHFSKRKVKRGALEQHAVARDRLRVIEWEDLPHHDLKRELLPFSTLAFSYRTFFYPLLTKHKLAEKAGFASWYVDNYLREGRSFDKESNNLKKLDRYLKTYLEWAYEMCTSTEQELRFVNQRAFRLCEMNNFDHLHDDLFGTLSPQDTSDGPSGFDALWNLLCEVKLAPGEGPTSAAGRLAHLLHRASQSFCAKNYNLEEGERHG